MIIYNIYLFLLIISLNIYFHEFQYFFILNFPHSQQNKYKQQKLLSLILYFIINIFNYFPYILHIQQFQFQNFHFIIQSTITNQLTKDQIKAFNLSQEGIIPDIQYCNPNLQNYDGYTIAQYLSFNSIIPPEQFNHNKYIRNYDGSTVQMLLSLFHANIPEHWQYPHEYDKIGTPAIQQARKGIIPNKENYHEPWISTYKGETVAYLLIRHGIQVPDEWKYDPEYKFIYKQTTAIILSKYGIIPDQYWMHDIDLKDLDDNSIRNNLVKYNYIYQNNQFIPNAQTEVKQKTCMVCLEDKEQEFIKTICGHNICLECYKELLKQDGQYRCPVCRKYDWFIPIDNEQFQEYQQFQMYMEAVTMFE